MSRDVLHGLIPARVSGRVARVVGNEVEVRGLRLRVGDAVDLHTTHGSRPAEVVALSAEGVRALLFGDTTGVGRGDVVTLRTGGLRTSVSEAMVGRVLDAFGRVRDGGPQIVGEPVELELAAPDPMTRSRITRPLPTGVRVIDSLCTLGRGQRMGIFAGSGVGKSTLLSMMARGTDAEVNVVGLIGERGREVREFIEDDLGPEGMARTIMVVATSDEPPLMRLRAAHLATRIAEWFADNGGRDVLLMMDSLTRLAMAQREVGLAAGEPPTARGYTPSVFSLLPRLLERAGPRANGSITGIYTVLTEGADVDADPIADAVRAILDGHIHLDRGLLHRGRLPAIDPLASMSRLAPKVTDAQQVRASLRLRSLLAAVEEVRDMVEVGAYVTGTNPDADKGMALWPAIEAFLQQDRLEVSSHDAAWAQLLQLVAAADGAPAGDTTAVAPARAAAPVARVPAAIALPGAQAAA